MRSKTPLVLTELIIMLLVFTLAAGLCLRAFLWADETSRRSARADAALTAARNAAELTKHHKGDLATAAAEYGGTYDGESWSFTAGEITVTVTLLPTHDPLLGLARVTAGETALTAAWQEELPHEE